MSDPPRMVSGTGFTAGGGISYFFTPSAALEASLDWSFGESSEVSLVSRSANLQQYAFSATSTGFDLGLSWYPRGR